MTDEQNVVSESSGEVAQNIPSEAPQPEQVAMQPEQATEKMVPQSKVNEIVGATKKSAYEKAKSEFASQQNTPETSQSYQPNVEELVGSKISEYFNEIAQAQQAELAKFEAQKTLDSLKAKVDTAASKYEDFEEVTKDIPYASFPDLLSAADTVENSGDVLYHLGKNPSKFRELASALSPENPLRSIALKELNQLASSLKNNEAARNKDLPRDPLSTVRPSNVGMDSGKKSIAELRKKYTV